MEVFTGSEYKIFLIFCLLLLNCQFKIVRVYEVISNWSNFFIYTIVSSIKLTKISKIHKA